MENLALVLPSDQLAAAYRNCEADFQRADETFLGLGRDEYQRFVQFCSELRRGLQGRVAQTDYFLVRDGATIIGRSALRRPLTDALRVEGGHIGYRIRPSERRRGYGAQLLAMTLVEARTLGLDHALLTCDSDNIGSRSIIERNGGQLWTEGPGLHAGRRIARYWIHLS